MRSAAQSPTRETGEAAPAEPVGLATVGFSVLEARAELQRMRDPEDPSRSELGHPESCLSQDILDRLGVSWIEARAGRLRLMPTP